MKEAPGALEAVPQEHFASVLKLTASGYKDSGTGNAVQGSLGYYWTSTASAGNTTAARLEIRSNGAGMNNLRRGFGLAVRCIQE